MEGIFVEGGRTERDGMVLTTLESTNPSHHWGRKSDEYVRSGHTWEQRREAEREARRKKKLKKEPVPVRQEDGIYDSIWRRLQVIRGLNTYFQLQYRLDTSGIDKHLEDSVVYILEVRKCLAELEPRSRQLVWYLFREGKTQAETADQLGSSRATIRRERLQILDALQSRFFELGLVQEFFPTTTKPAAFRAA